MVYSIDSLSEGFQENNPEVRENLSNLIALLEMTSESVQALSQYDPEALLSESDNVVEHLTALSDTAENLAPELTDLASSATQAFTAMLANHDAVIGVMNEAETALSTLQSRLTSELEPMVEEMGSSVNESVGVFGAIAAAAANGQGEIESEAGEVLDFLTEFVQQLDELSEQLESGFASLNTEFQDLNSAITDGHQTEISDRLEALKTMVDDQSQQVESDLSSISEQLTEKFEDLTQAITDASDTLKEEGTELIQGALESLENSPLDEVFERLLSTAEQLGEAVDTCLESATEGNAILEPIQNVLSMVANVLEQLRNFRDGLSELL